MSCFNKIKRALETGKGVRVIQEGDYLIISKDGTVLTRYNLMFVEYSDNNTNGFIDYWKCRLGIKDSLKKKVVSKIGIPRRSKKVCKTS